MATYDDLEVLIGRLKQSLIDAFVVNVCAMNHVTILITDAGYVGAPTLGLLNAAFVTRPDFSGQGGGEIRCWPPTLNVPQPLMQKLITAGSDACRNWVESTFHPWRGLPDPVNIKETVEKCKTATLTMQDISKTPGGVIQGSGRIFDDLRLLEKNIDGAGMMGDTASAFRRDFLNRLPTLTLGLHSLVAVAGMDAGAEFELWTQSRQAVADIISTTIDANVGVCFRKRPSKKSLRLFACVAKGVEGFTGKAGKYVGLLAEGIELLVEFGEDEWFAEAQYIDITTCLAGVEASLNTLNAKIQTAERAIDTHLREVYKKVNENYNTNGVNDRSYDLTPPVIGDGFAVTMKPQLCRSIARVDLPGLADDFDVIAGRVRNCSLDGKLARNAAIGMAPFGPAESFFALVWLNYELVADTVVDVRNAAANLEGAVDLFEHTDKEHRDKLGRLADAVKAGSGIDFWNAPGEK
jgi:hypothetical protein